MPHYSTSRNGMTKYGKKTGGGAKVKGAGSNTDKGKKKNSKNSHNNSY